MKKILLLGFLSFLIRIFSQTYCIPTSLNGCSDGDQIDSFEIPDANFSHLSSGCSQNAYGNFTSQVITMKLGVNYPFTIIHKYSDQNVRIWVDFNRNGIFEDESSELIVVKKSASISSSSGTVFQTQGVIFFPITVSTGTYRMRVGDSFTDQPTPCSTNNYGETHDYTINIAAAPGCLAPQNVTAHTITSSSAQLMWTAPLASVGTGFEYYLSTSGIPPNNSTVGSITGAASSIVLSNLTPATTYYAWVRALCTNIGKSQWSMAASFTTSCVAVVPPYQTDFSLSFPGCWKQVSGGSLITGPTEASTYWYGGNFLNFGINKAVKINLFNKNITGWLKTIPFNLSGGSYRVRFDYGVTKFGQSTPSAMGSDDTVQFIVSHDGGNTWTAIHTWNASNSPLNVLTQYSKELGSYAGSHTIFAFYASSGNVIDAEDYEFFVDNFVIEVNTLSISETSEPKNTVRIYPNPFSDFLNISDVKNVKSISIIDSNGRLVKTITHPGSAIYLKELASGMYFINIIMKNGTQQTHKIIKQ